MIHNDTTSYDGCSIQKDSDGHSGTIAKEPSRTQVHTSSL